MSRTKLISLLAYTEDFTGQLDLVSTGALLSHRELFKFVISTLRHLDPDIRSAVFAAYEMTGEAA